MPDAETFFDTNVLLCLLSADNAKADRAEELLANGDVIGVQVLNECAAVGSRKLGMSWSEITEALDPVRAICKIEPVTLATHDRAIATAGRYGYSIYDATIVASALMAGCKTLYSEDLQEGHVVEKRLTIRNPFA